MATAHFSHLFPLLSLLIFPFLFLIFYFLFFFFFSFPRHSSHFFVSHLFFSTISSPFFIFFFRILSFYSHTAGPHFLGIFSFLLQLFFIFYFSPRHTPTTLNTYADQKFSPFFHFFFLPYFFIHPLAASCTTGHSATCNSFSRNSSTSSSRIFTNSRSSASSKNESEISGLGSIAYNEQPAGKTIGEPLPAATLSLFSHFFPFLTFPSLTFFIIIIIIDLCSDGL